MIKGVIELQFQRMPKLRTGPNVAYPVIYQVEKGDTFTRLSKSGKWIEVESRDGSEKVG